MTYIFKFAGAAQSILAYWECRSEQRKIRGKVATAIISIGSSSLQSETWEECETKCIWKKLQNMFSKYKCSGVNAKVGGPSLKLNEENCCNVNRRTRRRNATRRMKNSICTSRNAFLYKDSHLCVHMCVCSILPFFLHYISLFC